MLVQYNENTLRLLHAYVKSIPHWLPAILIILPIEVHLNTGPQFQNNFFNFMSRNVNLLVEENFLIEADNSIFNYDLNSICETSLNDTVELPTPPPPPT